MVAAPRLRGLKQRDVRPSTTLQESQDGGKKRRGANKRQDQGNW